MLLHDFKKHGLTSFIPRYQSPGRSEIEEEEKIYGLGREDDIDYDYNGGVTFPEGITDTKDPYNPDFDAFFFEYEDEESDSFEYSVGEPDDGYCFENIETLKDFFGYGYLSDEDFLDLGIEDIFGLPANQMKYLDGDLINSYSFDVIKLIELLKSDYVNKNISDPIQRIKYCTVTVLTDADRICAPFISDELRNTGYRHPDNIHNSIRDYVKRIILRHDINTSHELLLLLADYYGMWSDGMVLDIERKENGEHTFNYPICPKPSHIRDLHDKIMRDHATIQGRADAVRDKYYNDCIEGVNLDKKYKKILYSDDSFVIKPVQNVGEIRYEGAFLNHCVSSYIPKFAEGNTFLYFLRKREKPDIPYFTLEVSPEKTKYVLRQCYTTDDSIKKSDTCAAFIKKWAGEKKIQIGCEI